MKKYPKGSIVVLSVGGNDVREILGKMSEIQNALKGLQQNYPKIVKEILEYGNELILLTQYRPDK